MDILVVVTFYPEPPASPKLTSDFPKFLEGRHYYMPRRVLRTTPCKLRRFTYCFELTAHLNFSRFYLTVDTLVLSVSHTDTTKTAWAEFTSAVSIIYRAHKKRGQPEKVGLKLLNLFFISNNLIKLNLALHY